MVTSILTQTTQSGSTSSAGSKSPQPGTTPQPEMCGGTSGFLMIMIMMVMMFIMFDPDLRLGIAFGLEPIFSPIFAFDGAFPILTLLCTAILLIACSTTIRHFMTDWIGLARAQERMSGYQKELREATLAKNTAKIAKLEKVRPQIMQMQSITMISSIKPAVFTMIIFIVVFPWLWAVFIPSLSEPPRVDTVTLPWASKWAFTTPLAICGPYGGYWIIMYFILSLPFGMLLQHGLKMISYSRKIRHSEELQYSKTFKAIEDVNLTIDAAKDMGVRTPKPRDLLLQAKSSLENKDYTKAKNLVREAEDEVNRLSISHNKTNELLNSAESMIIFAEEKGVGVRDAKKALADGKKAILKSDYTTAIYFAKQAKRKVKEAKELHKDAEDTLASVKATMYDLRELETTRAESMLKKAEKALKDQSYEKVMEHLRDTKREAEDLSQQYQSANKELTAAKSALDSAIHLGVEVPKAEELYIKAHKNLESHNYSSALNLANQCREIAEGEKNKFQGASEAVSFAKLIISNAQTFGAEVTDAEVLVRKAEDAITKKDYGNTIKYANQAKEIAEQAKRQQQRSAKRSY